MGHSRPLFSLFSSFQYTVDSKQMFNKYIKNLANDWIRIADLEYRKQTLYQLSHNHFGTAFGASAAQCVYCFNLQLHGSCQKRYIVSIGTRKLALSILPLSTDLLWPITQTFNDCKLWLNWLEIYLECYVSKPQFTIIEISPIRLTALSSHKA